MSLQKKLDKAYNEGYIAAMQEIENAKQTIFLEGIRVGAEATTEVWLTAVTNTKGIGPKLLQNIKDQAQKEHDERRAERRKLAAQTKEASA